jgi:putative long chain acyl-CoA synthase
MPRSLWRRVEERFAPARVLEFYASTEAGAVLVNLRDAKPGALGRPLPGSAQVKLARYDLTAGGLIADRDGLARECAVDEVGMLLARVRRSEPLGVVPLRGVFSPGDAWLVTGDLFRRDREGDYWRVDAVADVITTAAGPVFSTPIRDAVGALPSVDLAVAYGVSARGTEQQVAVAAVTLRRGRELTPRDIAAAVRDLEPGQRPTIVHVVDEIPVTTWYRPITGPLRAAGVPEPGEGIRAWYLSASGETYRPLTAAARRRIAGSARSRGSSANGSRPARSPKGSRSSKGAA